MRGLAEKIMEQINSYGDLNGKLWDKKDGELRIYVSRKLSKNLQQIGFIRINSDNTINYCLDRNKSGIQSHIEKGLKNL